jgi:hypothetical protein
MRLSGQKCLRSRAEYAVRLSQILALQTMAVQKDWYVYQSDDGWQISYPCAQEQS